MDELYKRRGLWIGLAALGFIFLCVMLCVLGAFFSITSRSGVMVGALPQAAPPAGGESVAPPAVQYYSPGPVGIHRHGGFHPFSILMKLFFFGLLLLLGIGLLKRIFWGPRRWAHYHRWAHQGGKPPAGMWPKDKQGKHPPHPAWGPWAWHAHGACWGPEDTSADTGDAPADAGDRSGEDESEYSGPQE